jgi:hypothetical protein
MKEILKKIPTFVFMFLLALLYLACGYLVGYYQGYQSGQDDYADLLQQVGDN